MPNIKQLTVEEAIVESTKLARGTIIQLAIEIEKMLEFYIGKCFCKTEDKITEFILLIISPHIQFGEKKDLFIFLIQNHNKRFYAKHKSSLSKIGQIIQQRNILAHWPVDFSPNAKNDFTNKQVIHFVKIKPPKKAKSRKDLLYPDIETYSEKKVNAIIKEAKEVDRTLRLLLGWTAAPPM